jgi:5-formyltetrahydrofolate cyclo-ligase
VDLETGKRLLRRSAHRIRNAIDSAERNTAAREITNRILELPELDGTCTVLSYVSIRTEVPTSELNQGLQNSGHTVLLPRVEPDGGLTARPIGPLAPGFMGIPEPVGDPVPWHSIQIALVPGLAFDPRGHRLGYGGGYFDRALMAFRGVIIGVAFDQQLVDEIPTTDDDVDVDLVVTESQVLRVAT